MTINYLPINRELTDKEKSNQLFQKRRLKLKTENLYDNLSVIKLNSTYLETTDIYYAGRGFLSFWYLIIGVVFLVFILFLLIDNFLSEPEWGFFFISLVLCSLVMFCLWFAFRSDSFCLTHYPIRFNRKNKKIYAFTRDQGLIIADWNKLFFTLDHYWPTALPGKEYAIRAHVFSDEDVSIVINTFELGIFDYSQEPMMAYWEFIRRYMEDGADSVSSVVEFCLPIANKKPSWKYETAYPFAAKMAFEPSWLTYLLCPFTFCICIGRLFSMSTSKVPIWSNDIDRECLIDKKDKINLSETINKSWNWKQGWTKEPWCKRMGNTKDYSYFN